MFPKILLTLLLCGTCSAASLNRIYVFGDRYSDSGAGYLDGDGPTAVVYFADRLHLKLLPSTDSQAGIDSSLNFAVSGAGTGRGTGRKVGDALLGLGMQNQVEDFSLRVKSGRVQFDPAGTLFFLAGGLNDKRLESELTVRNLKSQIRELYRLGGTNFALAILPTAIPAFRDVGLRLNPELAKIPGEMTKELPGISIRLSNWGKYLDEIMEHPSQYAIDNTADACAGRAIFKEDASPCKTPASHYYYHAGHPSTAVHKIVGEKLFAEWETKTEPKR